MVDALGGMKQMEVDTVNEITLFVLALAALLGSALIAGTFFAFSSFVMKALADLPAPGGIAAMQSINVVVINAWVMVPLFGTAVAGIAAAVMAQMIGDHAREAWLAAGAALYVIGTLGVTVAFNVPRNDDLAHVDATAPDAVSEWSGYVTEWTRWNHVRTAAAAAATLCYGVGLSTF